MQKLCGQKILELEAQAQRITLMRDLLQRAQKCRCIDVEECGGRILRRRQ